MPVLKVEARLRGLRQAREINGNLDSNKLFRL